MMNKERKLLSRILNSVVIATISVAIVAVPKVPTNVSGQGQHLVFEGSSDTGSDVLNVDISDGNPDPGEVYAVVGSAHNLSVFDGEGKLQWYNSNRNIADYGSYGTSHGVAISGNAEYVVAGDTDDSVYVYDITGTEKWRNDMRPSSGDCYSVDVSNPLARHGDYDAFVVSCSGNRFYVFNASSNALLWHEQIANGTVINVRISEDGNWVAASSNARRIEFWNNTDPSNHYMVWSYDTTDPYVNIDIGRTGLGLVAGEDDPSNGDTSNVYAFHAGADQAWGTLDDAVPAWIREEPRDIYAVAVSDSEILPTGPPPPPPFGMISGQTWNDNDSEESYWTSSAKIRSWPTGVAASADATYDNTAAYNFRLFGCWDGNVTLVAQDSNNIIDYYTTNGRVNAVAISFSFISENTYQTRFDYFVAGSFDDSVYFFTYDYT